MKPTPKHLPIMPAVATKGTRPHQDYRVEVVNGVFVLTPVEPSAAPRATSGVS